MENFGMYFLFAVAGLLIGVVLRGKSANKEISELNDKHQRECDRLKNKITRMSNWIRDEVFRRQKKDKEKEAEERAAEAKLYPPDAKINYRDPNPFSLFENFQNDDDPFSLPPGVSIDKEAFLILGNKSKGYPYGNYTVFITPVAEVYHTRPSCRNLCLLYPENIMRVLETRRPCSFCGHGMPQSKKLPKWYTNFRNASIDMDIEW